MSARSARTVSLVFAKQAGEPRNCHIPPWAVLTPSGLVRQKGTRERNIGPMITPEINRFILTAKGQLKEFGANNALSFAIGLWEIRQNSGVGYIPDFYYPTFAASKHFRPVRCQAGCEQKITACVEVTHR